VDPEAAMMPIPILSVQPLVENAVKHGIAPKPTGGLVRLKASLDDRGALCICVSDTGDGFHGRSKSGVGLDNVSRRLQLCYGAEARLEIQSGADGCAVSFVVPAAVTQARTAEVSL